MSEEALDIRYTRSLDISHLRRWLQDPRILRWFPASHALEIEPALSCWIGFARYQASLTATINGNPCGIATLFLMPYKKLQHHCYFKICVASEYQRRGVGTDLLRNIKHLAKTHFNMESIYIEVFEGNPLISLLEKLDFKEFVRQERYVKIEGRYYARVLMGTLLKEGAEL
jgi:putative acetyltransferase